MGSTCVNVNKVHVTRSFNDSTGMLIMCNTCSLQDNEKVDCIKHCIICTYRNAVRLTGTNIKRYKHICSSLGSYALIMVFPIRVHKLYPFGQTLNQRLQHGPHSLVRWAM